MRPSLAAVVLQGPPPGLPDIAEIDLVLGVASSAVGAFVTTLIVGAILVALAPEYTERMMDGVREDVFGSFLYGLLFLVALILLTVALVLTIFGILVAIPLIVLSTLVWAVGAAIAYLAIAERLVGLNDGWLKPLLVAALLNGGLALTAIGGLVSFAVGATGFGAVLRDYF
jgi:hypothetical protein